MNARVVLFLLAAVVCAACNTQKIDNLARQNDSLRTELARSQAIIADFAKLTASIDSMRGLRQVTFTRINGSTAHEAMSSKIRAINNHVFETEKLIKSLHSQLKSSKYENSAYVMMMDAVKSELQIRVSEVAVLEGNIADIEQTNQEISTEKEVAVTTLLSQVNEKQQALAELEQRLHRLESDFRNIEAEAVYARALAVEESARKTRLAPAKKREALTEALELYKKAKALGKMEASANIQALQKFETARAGSNMATVLQP